MAKVDLLFNVLENNWYNICRVLENIKEIAVMSKVLIYVFPESRVALLYFRTFKIRTLLEVKREIYSCALEPCSTDSLGHQHHAKKVSPEIALHLK